MKNENHHRLIFPAFVFLSVILFVFTKPADLQASTYYFTNYVNTNYMTETRAIIQTNVTNLYKTNYTRLITNDVLITLQSTNEYHVISHNDQMPYISVHQMEKGNVTHITNARDDFEIYSNIMQQYTTEKSISAKEKYTNVIQWKIEKPIRQIHEIYKTVKLVKNIDYIENVVEIFIDNGVIAKKTLQSTPVPGKIITNEIYENVIIVPYKKGLVLSPVEMELEEYTNIYLTNLPKISFETKALPEQVIIEDPSVPGRFITNIDIVRKKMPVTNFKEVLYTNVIRERTFVDYHGVVLSVETNKVPDIEKNRSYKSFHTQFSPQFFVDSSGVILKVGSRSDLRSIVSAFGAESSTVKKIDPNYYVGYGILYGDISGMPFAYHPANPYTVINIGTGLEFGRNYYTFNYLSRIWDLSSFAYPELSRVVLTPSLIFGINLVRTLEYYQPMTGKFGFTASPSLRLGWPINLGKNQELFVELGGAYKLGMNFWINDNPIIFSQGMAIDISFSYKTLN